MKIIDKLVLNLYRYFFYKYKKYPLYIAGTILFLVVIYVTLIMFGLSPFGFAFFLNVFSLMSILYFLRINKITNKHVEYLKDSDIVYCLCGDNDFIKGKTYIVTKPEEKHFFILKGERSESILHIKDNKILYFVREIDIRKMKLERIKRKILFKI